jgi:hypothetical protein
MIAAMMFPLLVQPLAHVVTQNFLKRQWIAQIEFLLGYLSVWMVVAVVSAWTVDLTTGGALSQWVAVGLLALASFWSLTPVSARGAAMCNATRPLAPGGLSATTSTLRYGALIGRWCVVSCGPVMLACALSGHALTLMLGGMAICGYERLAFRASPNAKAGLAATLAAVFALQVLMVDGMVG